MRPFRYSPGILKLIKRHAANRRDAAAIARLVGCLPSTIVTICNEHGIELVKQDGAPPLAQCRRPAAGPGTIVLEVPIGSTAMEAIRQEANRRGCKPNTLVSRLAEIVATDKIFSAVLDQ